MHMLISYIFLAYISLCLPQRRRLMFKTNNVKIGKHLGDLIKKSQHKNDRQFCIAYLTLRDGEANPDDIQKMQNRICQIKNGKKGVQIEDLPIFSDLLGVSIEDILSAGTVLTPVLSRKTNYSIAFSKDPAEWEEYIQRDDKLILNPDEYDKTAIDYALEAGNYPFLKYLTEKGYIWFVGDDKPDYYHGFGAGTSIKRRDIGFHDILDIRMRSQDDLRFKMIALAIRNKDFEMLTILHAREIPLLYTINPIQHWTLKDEQLPLSPNIGQMIDSIAASETAAISYFFDEFIIETENRALQNTYIFPYASQVLDALIVSRRIPESKRFLEKSIEHNKRIQKKLQKLVDKSKVNCKEFYNTDPNSNYYDETYFHREAWKEYYFYPKTGFITYYMPFYLKNATGFITNVINVTVSSKNTEIQFLIDELKKTYSTFIKQYEKKET